MLRCHGPNPCLVYSISLRSRGMTPLVPQPPLLLGGEERVPVTTVGGTVYATGADPDTDRPAVAWSRDAGRTWTTHTFADATPCPRATCPAIRLTSLDGRSAYAEVNDAGTATRRTYHTTGDGRWQPVAGAKAPPFPPGAAVAPFIAADGTYVAPEVVRERDVDTVRFWAHRNGSFAPVELRGLPATVHSVIRTPEGRFYAPSYPDGALYGSADGWTWSLVAAADDYPR
jgi:hypothetical protein